MRRLSEPGITSLTIAVAAACIGCMGCYNPDTPAGFEGYLRQGAIVGSARYYGSQSGPTSAGLSWLLTVDNVEFRWKTAEENFQVLSSDNLNLTFKSHIVIRPQPGSVKQIVEVYGGSDWYTRVLQQPFRNAVYEAVAGYKALDAKDRREVIADKVKTKFMAYLHGKPFEVQAIIVGTINLPDDVAKAQNIKITKETELAQKEFEISIAKKEAEVKVAEAQGIAESQKIINATLTPYYLQHEAIKTQEKLAASPNTTFIYIPSGPNGIPITGVTGPASLPHKSK